MKIREFTRDDWYGWAGAEEFKDGDPLICEETVGYYEFYAIADATGIEFHMTSGDPEGDYDMTWRLNASVKSQRAMRRLLESYLAEFGDEPSSSVIITALDTMVEMESL